ncbi:unnamed protein product [Larinioides sclopetarius]|uniref:Uncharacterized protein n=1 Tax=Larinioides sclopetarius TaxID=280406 RepID=A0AAV1Z0Y1_9ARAC
MRKDLTYEKIFGSNRSQRLFDEEESSVASYIYRFAYDEIHASQVNESDDFDADCIENFSAKTEELMIRFERLAEILGKSRKAMDNFLRGFQNWAPHCKKTVESLRKIAEALKGDKFNRDISRTFGSVIAAIGGILLGLSLPASAPLSIAGAAAFAAGNGLVVKTTTEEIAYVKKRLDEVKELLEKEKEKFSYMTNWFSRPQELENSINYLVDYNIVNEIKKEVQKLTEEVTGEKDITEEEFKNQFGQLLKHCMGLMAKDSKMIDEYGKELAPAVMTFVFVVFFMNDHNRVVLDCSLITQHLALSLMDVLNIGTLTGSSAIADAAVSKTFIWISVAINAMIAVLSLIDLCRQPETKHTKEIKEAADKIEKVYLFIESVYNKTLTYKPPEYAAILVNNAPEDAEHADLRNAVSNYLPEEALNQIKVIRLPTEESSWLVKIPKIYSRVLLQQTEIKIKRKNCVVTH